MKLSLTIAEREIFSIGAGKAARTPAITVEDHEQTLGAEPPFDLSKAPMSFSRSAWVYACVSEIIGAVQSVTVEIGERDSDGEYQPSEDNPPAQLFASINPHQTDLDFLAWTFGSLELQGTTYHEIERNVLGEPMAFWPMFPQNTTIVPDRKNFIKGYIYSQNGKDIALKPEDVLCMRYYNPSSFYYGLPPWKAALTSLSIDAHAQGYNLRFFQNDARPGGVLETDRSMNEKQAKELKDRWNNAHKGRKRAWNVAVMSEGLKYKPTMALMRDMLFKEMREMSREEITACFKIPPGIVGIMRFANYANYVVQRRKFWESCIIPKLRIVERSMNQGLMRSFGMIPVREGLEVARYRFRFNLSNVEALKEDANDKTERETKQITSGSKTPNEVRIINGDPEMPGGDILLINRSMVPLTEVGQPGIVPGTGGDIKDPVDSEGKFLPSSMSQDMAGKTGAEDLHFDSDRKKGIIERPTQNLFLDLNVEVLNFLQAQDRMKRLRTYAVSTEDPDRPRDRRRDAEMVNAIFTPFTWHTEQAERITADFAGPYKKLYEDAARLGAKKVRLGSKAMFPHWSDHGGEKGFELVNPTLLGMLDHRASFWIGRGLASSYDAMQSSLVSEYFDKYMDTGDAILLADLARTLDYAATWQAERTARTETLVIGQEAQREMFDKSGVEVLAWSWSGVSRVNHSALHAKQIDLAKGERFSVGAYQAKGPGDPVLGPEEVCNCGCDTYPVVKQAPETIWTGE